MMQSLNGMNDSYTFPLLPHILHPSIIIYIYYLIQSHDHVSAQPNVYPHLR